MKEISILIPAYNEEEVLPAMKEALEKATANLSNYAFEFLFINDGSTDRTQEMLHAYHLKEEPCIAHNGKHWDLQHKPNLYPKKQGH